MRAAHLAIVLAIFVVFCIAWLALGLRMELRSKEVLDKNKVQINSNWGGNVVQSTPQVYYLPGVETGTVVAPTTVPQTPEVVTSEGEERPPVPATPESERVYLSLSQEKVSAGITMDYRKRGLLWFNTYVIDFDAIYSFENDTDKAHQVYFNFTLPQGAETFEALLFKVDGVTQPITDISKGLQFSKMMEVGESHNIEISYRGRGVDSWVYGLGGLTTQHKDFTLTLNTGFKEVDVLATSVSPNVLETTDKGATLTWKAENLISKDDVGISVPEKTNPFEIAKNLCYFAPLSFLLFLATFLIMIYVRRISLHPMHIVFVGAAYFVFNLLLAYLVKYMNVYLAFGISFVVSALLILIYLGRVTEKWLYTLRDTGLGLLLFLGVFPLAFFTVHRGLILTIGIVIALAALMMLTAKVKWGEGQTEKSAPLPPPYKEPKRRAG
jgi:hypothetical protein